MSNACLEWRDDGELLRQTVNGSVTIGRSPDANIALVKSDVSWCHAEIRTDAEGLWLIDLGSRNGTRLNGAVIDRSGSRLRHGDTIEIAGMSLLVRPGAVTQSGVRLDAEDLSHAVWSNGHSHKVLSSVSVSIQPGELVAVLGASGAGKTSLMLGLAGFQRPDSGRVLYNGIDVYAHPDAHRRSIGYVPQADIVHGDLPVRRALLYTARLRIPEMGERERNATVARTLDVLGLQSRSDTLIRDLSGGERKRANIAAELLTSPSLLFLDEPTSGLDAGLERRIARGLRDLARDGRTIVSVTHSLEAINEFDRVLVMAKGGRLAFFGKVDEALGFFGVRTLAEVYDAVEDTSRHHVTRFALRRPVASRSLPSTPPAVMRTTNKEFVRQTLVLVERYMETVRSDARNLMIWGLQVPAIAALLCVIYDGSLTRTEQTVDANGSVPLQDFPTLLLLMTISIVCFGLFNASREIVKERRIYDRERHVGMLLGPYLLSKVVVLGSVAIIQALLLTLLVSLRIPMGLGAGDLIWFVGLLALAGLNATLIGLAISANAKGADQAVALTAPILLVSIVFSGLIPLEKLGLLGPLSCLSASRWTLGGLCGLVDVPGRFARLGLDTHLHEVLKTDPLIATISLVLLALASSFALVSLMVRRRQSDVR